MDFSHISSYLSSDSRSGWREKLLEASFRGVPFPVRTGNTAISCLHRQTISPLQKMNWRFWGRFHGRDKR